MANPKGLIKTERDIAFVNLWAAENFDPAKKVKCAEMAGFPPGAPARANAGRVSKNMAANMRIQRALKKRGIDPTFIADKLYDLMNAQHPKEGTPDGFVQLKATETVLKLNDMFPAAKLEIDKSERKEIVISGEVIQRLETHERQKELLSEFQVIDVQPESFD